MSGILQVTLNDASHNVFKLIDEMETTAKMLRVARTNDSYTSLDWEVIRQRVDERFAIVFSDLMLDENGEEIDLIEGEEMHPLDPENGEDEAEDEWHEGFDDQ